MVRSWGSVVPCRAVESLAGRVAVLGLRAGGDALREGRRRILGSEAGLRPDALESAIDWLCRTHDATGRNGSSKGYSLVRGWLPAYPETTGYVIGTLLQYHERTGRHPELRQRAIEMGEFEVRVQGSDGGTMQGDVSVRPRRSIVFNTGQVLHGFVDLLERGEERFHEPGARAAAFLVDRMQLDGTWAPDVEYSRIPHTYNSRVSWAMLRWATTAGDEPAALAAHRQLDWVVAQQRPSGWFANNVFKLGTHPSTHAVAYTLRGLLESYVLAGERSWLDAVLRASEPLIRKLEVFGRLPAEFEENWSPAAEYECLTGTAQLGGVWLRLYQIGGDSRFLNAGLKALDLAGAHQETLRAPSAHGALPGSFPVWGRYAPLQYPNWATKFFADALMVRDDCLSSGQ